MLALISVLLLAAGPRSPEVPATPAPATATATTVRAWVVEEEIRVVADGRPASTGTRKTFIAPGRIRRESSLDGNVILVRAGHAVPLAIVDRRARTWFGYEAAVLAKADIPGPLLEGLGVDEKGQPFGPAEPFRAIGGKPVAVGSWQATPFTATAAGAGGMETELWLANRPGGIPNDAALDTLESVYARKGGRLEPYFAGLAKLSGFPVRSVFRMKYPNGVRSEATITVTRISEEEVSVAQFEIPEGIGRIPDPIGISADPQ